MQSPARISASASIHGGELLNAGFTIGQVVQDYVPGKGCVFTVELRRSVSEAATEQGSEFFPD